MYNICCNIFAHKDLLNEHLTVCATENPFLCNLSQSYFYLLYITDLKPVMAYKSHLNRFLVVKSHMVVILVRIHFMSKVPLILECIVVKNFVFNVCQNEFAEKCSLHKQFKEHVHRHLYLIYARKYLLIQVT